MEIIGFDKVYTKASGPYLWDQEGRKYLDTLSGYGVFNMGRNHSGIRQALSDFMAMDYPSLVQMDAPLLSGLLAERLISLMPDGLDTAYFTSGGAEGVETAIKFSRAATGKPAILFANGAFHGLSNGALALNGAEFFRENFAPYLPGCRSIPFNDLAALEEALAAGDVAAFVVEPIQGKGVFVPDDGYLREAKRLCAKHGALLVVDEVQTGMGRTGKFLALEHDAVEPDIVVMSKALSGGYVPVGAVLCRRWIYDKTFSSLDRAVVHSSTFGQGSLAMVAGLAAIEVLEQEKLVQNAALMGNHIMAGLRGMIDEYEFVKEVRGKGLMIGIEFGKPDSLGLKAAWKMAHGLDDNLFCQAITIPLMQDHGILSQVSGYKTEIIKFIPPLSIDQTDVNWLIDGMHQVMQGTEKFPGPVWDVLMRIGKTALRQKKQPLPMAAE